MLWFSLKRKLYQIHFNAIKKFIDWTTYWNCRPVGLAIGTLALELSTALCFIGRRLTYYKKPLQYGINHFKSSHLGKHPVILIHGRMSRWADLMDLALSIKSANLPVFVVSLDNQTPSEDDRLHIHQEIKTIQTLYFEKFGQKCPPIDIVGHSLGGDMALYSAFTPCCSIIECGSLKFTENPKCDPSVGRIITLGMPTGSHEVDWISAAGKKDDIFNVVAKFDAVMGNKESALTSKQIFEIEAGHLGLLSMATYIQVMHWLMLNR